MTKFNSGQENFVFSDKIKIHVFQKSTIWHFLRWMCTAKAQKLDVYCKSSKADKKRPNTGLGTLYDILPGVGHPSLSLNILLESGQVYCKKQSLPINCSELKLFPGGGTTDQTTPRDHSQCRYQGFSFYSSLTLAQTTDHFLSLCDRSRHLLREKAIHFSEEKTFLLQNCFFVICLPLPL